MSKNGTIARASGRFQKYRCKKCNYETHDGVVQQTEPLQEKTAGMTEEQFRAKFDLTFIVAKKCKELKMGVYLSMSEFIKFCGIQPGTGYRQVLEHPDFEEYRGKVRSDYFWSHPESIRKMKGEGLLM